MDQLTELVESFHLHNWYPFAALALTLGLQVFRKVPGLKDWTWARIPQGWRGYFVLASGALVAFVAAFQGGADVMTALWAAVGGAWSIGGGSMGLAAALKQSHLPWDGGAGGKTPRKQLSGRGGGGALPPGAACLALALLVGAAAVPACSSPTQSAAEPDGQAQIDRGAALAFNGATAALLVLDRLNAEWMRGIEHPTDDQLVSAEVRTGRLRDVRAALDVTRAWVAGERDPKDGRGALVEAARLLALVANELERDGVTLPPEVRAGLAAVSAYLGAPS